MVSVLEKPNTIVLLGLQINLKCRQSPKIIYSPESPTIVLPKTGNIQKVILF